ncbi:hypothetical protein [Nocardia cyriacigeorgica]|uniref:hypothetical protein n=1 Tax=Nocardia cyriacigeorgica TaxID=135487 RepID=UPI001892E864|nr:hypothetical protein [Nocardia cyriacigeorgica]MBF6414572.1 hypothetical protein [Nocardia cyriacigeorgica]
MKMIERRVLEDYNSGARRVLCLFHNEPSRHIARSAWNVDELRDEVAAATSDFERKQFQGYLFDTLELDIDSSVSPEALRTARNRFCAEFGASDFFEGYCSARGIDARGVERLAGDLLDRTEDQYMSTMRSVFGGTVDQDQFAKFYSGLLAVDSGNYTVDRIHNDLVRSVEDHGYSELVDIVRGSPPGVSTTVSTIDPRKSTVFLAEYGGLESYRAAFHALGHAVYAVSPDVTVSDLVGVNISATEVSAFSAQELALSALRPQDRQMLDFMPIYYARMYALRLLDEARFYREGSAGVASVREHERQLMIVPKSTFVPRNRLHSIDFVLAFSTYLSRRRTDSLSDVSCSVASNSSLLLENDCMMDEFKASQLVEPGSLSSGSPVVIGRGDAKWSSSSVMG